ncbi:hypothetical protein ACFVU2_06300 [Leifsonia sp. NPDC058194]|uniref:hypothetical protein n=1 Tax=Leifsonia sp. NPDC058194 TaxID=3346374 RepID=UPI0036D97AD7
MIENVEDEQFATLVVQIALINAFDRMNLMIRMPEDRVRGGAAGGRAKDRKCVNALVS